MIRPEGQLIQPKGPDVYLAQANGGLMKSQPIVELTASIQARRVSEG